MHTLALPISVLCIELGPQWPMAHYELAYLIKKKKREQARAGQAGSKEDKQRAGQASPKEDKQRAG